MPLNIIISSTPPHYKVTGMMIDDFMIDPVMGIKVIMGIELDAFQASRERTYWFIPNVIDSSGFSTGKSLTLFLNQNLRALLIGDQVIGQYFQTFETGKQVFWPYYRVVQGPIFRSQLGKTDFEGEDSGKANLRGPACWNQYFKNGSEIKMPAPSWGQDAKTQASLRYNSVGIDEWTKCETMGAAAEGMGVGGINNQILGRLTRASFNKDHPLWMNHMILTATAENMSHPAFLRYQSFKREVDRGNPNYAIISYNYKDFSDKKCYTGKSYKEEFRIDKRIEDMQAQFPDWRFVQEVLGVWARAGKGWYREEATTRCIAEGKIHKCEAMGRRSDIFEDPADPWYYFMGIDPAPAEGTKSDDGAIVILRARQKRSSVERGALERNARLFGRSDALPFHAPDASTIMSHLPADWMVQYVYAYKFRKASAEQWSGKIHQVHQRFQLTGIMMDPNGGGQWIAQVLNQTRQVIESIPTECTPIVTLEDNTSPHGEFLLNMFKRGDLGIEEMWPGLAGDDCLVDAMHVIYQEALENGTIQLPVPYNERLAADRRALNWTEEREWALRLLSQMIEQLHAITVLTRDDGTLLLTKRNARQYAVRGKKDIAYAGIYAFVRFLVWLKNGDNQFALTGDDAVMCYFMGQVHQENATNRK